MFNDIILSLSLSHMIGTKNNSQYVVFIGIEKN